MCDVSSLFRCYPQCRREPARMLTSASAPQAELLQLDLGAARGLIAQLQRERNDYKESCEEYQHKFWQGEQV